MPTANAADRAAQVEIGPHATILVDHVVGAEAPGASTFHFRLDPDRASAGVGVTDDGDLTIDWPLDQPVEVELVLVLESPAEVFLDGFVLGWRGEGLPVEERWLKFCVEAPLADGAPVGAAQEQRTLVVRFANTRDTYEYRLYVAYPTGETYSIDPKIYNQGDGGPPHRRR